MITTPVKSWRRQKDITFLIGKSGEIVEWTIVRTPPKSFLKEAPYPVVIVNVGNKKMIGQLVDFENTDLVKGRKVIAVLRKLVPETTESVINYVIKFKPLPIEDNKKIIVSAPGKIHLLGEHVVVYGKPAIISAVDKRCFVEISPRRDTEIEIISKNLRKSIVVDEKIIVEKTKLSQKKWEDFVKTNDKEILKSINLNTFDYAQICIGEALLYYKQNLATGFTLTINSEVISGMGSSSSLAVAIAGAVSVLLKKPFDKKIINEIAFSCEQKQHGLPSGGDNSACTYGGLIWYRNENSDLKLIHPISLVLPEVIVKNFYIVNTGKPKESTGEMVSIVKDFIEKNKEFANKILTNQEELTHQLLTALKMGDEKDVISIIKKSEGNLEELGVVSDYVKKIIRKIEQSGGAAKICGAGGNIKNTGLVLVYHQNKNILENLIRKSKLSLETILLGCEGVNIHE